MFAVKLLIVFSLFHPQLQVFSFQAPSNQDLSYKQFVKNAQDKPEKEEYDYIIIGGGTAGCPLAATLSSKYSVLILERGNDPTVFPFLLNKSGLLNIFMGDDNGSTPVQRFVSEDGVDNIRGRVLGGGSMINLGFYSRAHPEFFTKSGVNWDMEMVENAYQWVEETVVSQPNLRSGNWQSAFRKALLEGDVVPDNGYNLNHIVGTKTGGSIFDSNGRRHGAVELLNKANPQNIQVVIQATVKRIIFSPTNGLSATGVLYSDSKGKLHKAFIREKGEIIVSAGAIGSPQILLLSGVGPKSHLSSLKLPVILNQPHVGQFMSDNPRYGVDLALPFQLEPTVVEVVGILEGNVFIESFSTVLPFSFPNLFSILPSRYSPVNLSLASIDGKFSEVGSVGSLKLASSVDVGKNPIVRFNYYSDSGDLERCVRGLRKIVDLINTPIMNEIKTRDLEGNLGFKFIGDSSPENMADDGLVGDFCRKTVATFWHYHGGCLVGKVVDENYRVIGIKNLRVVDGSTFVETPGTNPMATVMMLGRYVGLKMLKQRLG